mgnify:CR=1 FL=1
MRALSAPAAVLLSDEAETGGGQVVQSEQRHRLRVRGLHTTYFLSAVSLAAILQATEGES